MSGASWATSRAAARALLDSFRKSPGVHLDCHMLDDSWDVESLAMWQPAGDFHTGDDRSTKGPAAVSSPIGLHRLSDGGSGRSGVPILRI